MNPYGIIKLIIGLIYVFSAESNFRNNSGSRLLLMVVKQKLNDATSSKFPSGSLIAPFQLEWREIQNVTDLLVHLRIGENL